MFHVEFRGEWIKFTAVVSHLACNVFCLTFTRNLWVLIERKILEGIYGKNRGLITPRTTSKSKIKYRTTVQKGSTAMLQAPGPCTTSTARRTVVRLAVRRRTAGCVVQSPGLFNAVFASCFGVGWGLWRGN